MVGHGDVSVPTSAAIAWWGGSPGCPSVSHPTGWSSNVTRHRLDTSRIEWPSHCSLSCQAPRAGTEHRGWTENEVTVPRQFAMMLGLESGARMLERVMTLTIDGEPVLTSTSYLPVDLTGGPGWMDVHIGRLALIGYDLVSGYLEDESRRPTPTERAALGMPKGVLLHIIVHPWRVLMDDGTVPAGVIILIRRDRVRLRF